VILDRTAFYPTSGGQPFDRGTLCDVEVTGVEVRESDGAVVHVLGDELATDQVVGEVDWDRRFDHMQQHTGQHILSAACEQLLDADTVSFHLGTEICTIDLAVARLPLEKIEAAEALVNRVIWEDRPITARFVRAEELAALPLRRPPQVDGPVRLIEIDGVDLNPCGGTHVVRTGEIGLLKVLRLEYRADETRVEFLCGGRALRDYHRKNQTVLDLSSALTVGHWELEEAVARLQEGLKSTRRDFRALRNRLMEMETAELQRSAVPMGSFSVVRAVWEGWEPGDLRAVALRVTEQPGIVALVASLGERVHLCVACSEGVEANAAELLRAALESLGGRGGGQPRIAQGSAPPAERAAVEAALKKVLSR
jgi:alanyl-tRNA synthetase